eukprot:gnl/TRDRNA2_/TRDRNA2_180021_c0_seq1.p1 gnl/TRDRNA2_/TRDRNA2_180021_c0~~gnl/TRDRNA2_/TRDRNA2_180021_c0_seq1.p1  ORF type:complete len:261 (+),score=26.40 gnl/TRDRNA2_/TRDRNA2_180021_c0_seq1:153-935(+)
MHIAAALDAAVARRESRTGSSAGVTRRPCPCVCLPCGMPYGEIGGHKIHVWCFLGTLVVASIFCIGMFEATRLSTHVLMSPCTIVDTEVVDIGTCTLCDTSTPSICEIYPIATARMSVTFKPVHGDDNVTGMVWYCKGRATADPCQGNMRFLDQLSLDVRKYGRGPWPGGPVPCTTGEVWSYMQKHASHGKEHECYYSSRDPMGEDVWLSMPSPGLVDHAWFQKHLEYPILLALGGLVLLSVLLGCLALEGAELWAAGLT